MLDQATELRKLVLRSMRETPPDGSPPPQRLVVCGAAVGVGVTTLSINLAIALSGHGCRVVLVDADWRHPDVARRCGLNAAVGIADVLAARRDIHEILQPGPGGIQVAAGCEGEDVDNGSDWREFTQQRLLRQLDRLGRHADLIVLDAGSGGHDVMQRFWRAANQVMLVTTPDRLTQTESCVALQRRVCQEHPVPLCLLLNRISGWRVEADAPARLQDAIPALREWNLGVLGCVPESPEIRTAGRTSPNRILSAQDNSLTQALDHAAARLLAQPPQPVSVCRLQGRASADCLNSLGLIQPQPGFSPIDI
ncbi:MAG: P-loop NTPase [Candidatus Anammoximicrobium sp.]|nr:P-loop NTPase [Candidatus Anammoximicrobium sp.]